MAQNKMKMQNKKIASEILRINLVRKHLIDNSRYEFYYKHLKCLLHTFGTVFNTVFKCIFLENEASDTILLVFIFFSS